MKKLILILLIAISGSVSAQEQYKDTIYVSTDKTTIIHVSGNTGFVNSIEIPKSTLDPKNTKGKLIYFKVDDIDTENSRIYRLKAVRPFNEAIYSTIISDDGLVFIIKYNDTVNKSYYKIDLKKDKPKEENQPNNDVYDVSPIKYTTKQIANFTIAKDNVQHCIQINNAVFFSVKKAYKDKNLIFIQLKITNKSLKDFTPDDFQIILRDSNDPVVFEFKQFFLDIIKAQSSTEGTIILKDDRVFNEDALQIIIKELNNNKDIVLSLPTKYIVNLPIDKSK